MDAESKCPVMHGANTKNTGEGTTNRDWWPNQLDISILHQHDEKSNPMEKDFNYREHFKKIDYDGLKKDLNELMTANAFFARKFHINSNIRNFYQNIINNHYQ